MRWSWLCLLLTLGWALGCGATQKRPTSVPITLSWPPAESALRDLDTLKNRSESSVDAAWKRAHYLLDTFDHARFSSDETAKRVLRKALATPATNPRVIVALTTEVDNVLSRSPNHSRARDARTLLEFDAKPPTAESAHQRLSEMRALAQKDSPLAANAKLRMAGYCERALRDSARAAPRFAVRVLSHCLFVFYSADARPYINADAATRPPAPDWEVLYAELDALYSNIARGRLSNAAAHRRQATRDFVEKRRGDFPALLRNTLAGAHQSPHSLHFDGGVVLRADLSGAFKLPKELAPRIQGDGRNFAVLATGPGTMARALLPTLTAVREAGAASVGLFVASPRDYRAPEGDYWHGRDPSQHRLRPGYLPLSLEYSGVARQSQTPRTRAARGADWDPRRHDVDLHLIIRPTGLVLQAPEGELARPTLAELGAELDQVVRAYPNHSSLVLVPLESVPASRLIAAAAIALFRSDGTRRLAQVAMAGSAPPSKSGSEFSKLVKTRAASRVEISPSALRDRSPILRRCFLKSEAPGTQITLELRGEAAWVAQGPKRGPLWACAQSTLEKTMVKRDIRRATVRFVRD